MQYKTVEVIPSILETKDQAELDKEFNYDGVTYTLIGGQRRSVPEHVADAWVASDENLRLSPDPVE